LLNRIKKKQEAVAAKAIAPNNKMYIWLLLGAIALTGLSLLVQDCDAAFRFGQVLHAAESLPLP